MVYPMLLKGTSPRDAPHFLFTTGNPRAKYENVASDFFCDSVVVDIWVNEAVMPTSKVVSCSAEYDAGLVILRERLGRCASPVPPMPMLRINPLKGISPIPVSYTHLRAHE